MRCVNRKPRIAVVSPWPPQTSGVADYASKLVSQLQRTYDIDIFHDPSIPPRFESLTAGITAIPAPLLPRLIGLRQYRAILYQMGNSRHHAFQYPLMQAHPGIVTLHDLRLTNFHETYAENPHVGRDHLEREIAYDRPVEADKLLRDLRKMRCERGGIPVALAARGIDLNRRVFASSQAVLVHSKWARERVISMIPEYAERTHHIPFGATSEVISSDVKSEIRTRLGFHPNAIILACLGFLGWGKMNEEAIEAFLAISQEVPRAILAFIGRDLDEGRASKRVQQLGISDRVRFLEGTTDTDLCDLAKACDIGVNLRREPTNGETSGTLFTLLRFGIPTIVTDIDSFRDEPDDVVVRVRWRQDGMTGLITAMHRLVADRIYREQISRNASSYVSNGHSWSLVASSYRAIIESVNSACQPGQKRCNLEILK